LLGLPAIASFGFTTGGQGANTISLAAARHHVLAEAGWDVEQDGLLGGPRVRVVATGERHATIDRALRLLGLGAGALEPVGALLGVALSSGFAIAYPIGLALAAGAMLFVVSHEVIPETHGEGHETPATIGLMAGFALMMVLDTMFA
jgi:hypothetical protein